MGPRIDSVLYPRHAITRRSTSIDFGENQIVPGLVRLSLLSAAHPPSFQPWWVRTSTGFYSRFILATDSSPWFRVCPLRLRRAIRTRFRFASTPEGLRLAADSNSPVHHAKGTRSAVAPPEDGAIGLPQLVGIRFQVLLTPLPGFFSSFNRPYWFAIGRQEVFSLTR